MNLSFFVLSIAVSVSSVACWTVFPLSGKLKEANSKPSVSPPVVTSTSTASPSRFPAPVTQSISTFNKPSGISGIATPSKDLLPPKQETNGITTPVRPSLFSASRIETPTKANVPSLITTNRPTTVLSRTAITYKPLLSTNPVKRTVADLLTPKIFINSVSKTQIEPITTITNEDDSETINKKSILEIKETSTLLTPVDKTIANDAASVLNTEAQNGDLKDIDAGMPVTETTSQATTSTTLEPISLPTTFTTASTSSSTQFIQSSISEDEPSSVEIITSPPIVNSTPKEEIATKLLTRVNEEIENSSSESTTILPVTSTSPSPAVSSTESEMLLTTIALNIEQSAIDVTKSKEGSSSESSQASVLSSFASSVTTISSSESEVATASPAPNVLLAAVEQPSIDLLPPKEVAAVDPPYPFFPFEPINVELVPPKEEYTSVYETSAA